MAFHFIRNFRNCENSPFTSSYFQAGAGRSEGNSEKVSERIYRGRSCRKSQSGRRVRARYQIGNFRLAGFASRKTPRVFREAIRSTAGLKISSGVREDAAYRSLFIRVSEKLRPKAAGRGFRFSKKKNLKSYHTTYLA